MPPAERYRAAGVDLDALDAVKRRIAELVRSTWTPLATGQIGAFGGMIRLPPDVADPVLVLSTDGVGTKVLVALRAGRHDTVGEDLVNHCVNDILVHGARPIGFLDYIAGSHLPSGVVSALVEGVARGCRAHQMTLLGGETAELPDLYEPGHYDLAGTIVGVVSEGRALHGERVQPGDLLVGYASNGLHTNGYSLVRRIVFDELRLSLDDEVEALGGKVGEVLLAVHRSYWQAMAPVLDRLHAAAHITGGGLPGNLSRVLPPGCSARVRRGSWPVPAVFRFLEEQGRLTQDEMSRVFNLGIGMVAIVPPEAVDPVRSAATEAGVATWVIGEIRGGRGVEFA
jgi:phosphoribosylformylglycinamidine cyclo-ligase